MKAQFDIYNQEADWTTRFEWHGGATFNVYEQNNDGEWIEVNCFTQYGIDTVSDAEEACYDWIIENGDNF